MTTRYNDALRNVGADAIADQFDGGTIKIYTGSQPAGAGDATAETLLCTVDIPTPAFGNAAGGVASKTGTWVGVAVATGTAGWFRMEDSGNTLVHDGSITATGGGGEIELATTSINTDGVVVINSATITQPAE